MSTDLSNFNSLSLPQKLQLVEELWDHIAESADSLPVPEWHKEELERRERENLSNPSAKVTWDEVKRQIREANG